MKKLIALIACYFAAMWLVVLWGMAPARASDAGTCYTVSDADARTYCLARARGDASMCYAIQRSDMRSLCLAEVRK